MKKSQFHVWPKHSFKEIRSVKNILKNGKTNYLYGDEGKHFEKEFANKTNCRFAVAVSNGTVALDLAIKSLNLKPKSEIIVTSRSFIASASSIILNNLVPVFADVDRITQNIDINSIKKVFSKKTSAVLCVHLGGMPCEMQIILKFAKQKKIKVIEDCSQAHGASYLNKSVGSFGDISTWSFCYDKIISTAGEGGMITTNNKKLYEFCWSYKDHGKNYKKFIKSKKINDGKFKFLHDNLGTNYRLTEIQSSIGRIQLRNIDKINYKRNKICKLIKDKLIESDIYYFQNSNIKYNHAFYKLYISLIKENLKRNVYNSNFIKLLLDNNIMCGVGTCSEIYLEKNFKSYNVNKKNFNNAKYLSKYSFAINVNHNMSLKYTKDVIGFLKILEVKYKK
jgi:dTDP-4-amino-4,6-dideoxygalactose transaminase